MSIDLKKARKNDFEIEFFNLINNSIFGKTMESVKKHRDIKLITTEDRKTNWYSNQINLPKSF